MRQNDKENPFIHLFQTAFGYYLYDVNTNQIIKIKQDTYERLSNQEKGYKTDTNEEIECIFRKNRALAPHERSAVPLGTDHCPVC